MVVQVLRLQETWDSSGDDVFVVDNFEILGQGALVQAKHAGRVPEGGREEAILRRRVLGPWQQCLSVLYACSYAGCAAASHV